MRFLVDNQLPRVLARHLRHKGFEAEHVRDLDLDFASDHRIWRLVCEQGYTLITKDRDFTFLVLPGETIGAVVWLRVGNCHTRELLRVLDHRMEEVIGLLAAGERLIELA